MNTPVPSQAQASSDSNALWSGLSLVWELGYLIAIPAAALGYLGAWLDKTYDFSPLFLILGLTLAFAFSAFIIVRRIKTMVARLK